MGNLTSQEAVKKGVYFFSVVLHAVFSLASMILISKK